MSKIRILPEQLANQIAAGEVVERPASVVKELVENSIDAGAKRIEIEIEGGGTRLIRVIDDGHGMDEDDMLLSIERHGTSKIRAEEDLAAIISLGFRGEAIPSIGSVSKLTITSRPKGSELGTRILLQYGKLTRVHEIGCSYGSSFEVRNLFGNTPARRKFLKTVRTELGHIDEIVKNYALGSPHITFILRVNDKETLHLNTTLSLEQRLAHILHFTAKFIPVDDKEGKCRVTGFLIPPEKAAVGPAKLRIFVNGRAIKDRMVAHGVAEGLRGFLMKGKNPSGFIHITLPANEVDVNVHPAKNEIRFRNASSVHTTINRAVAKSMQLQQQRMKSNIFGKAELPETTIAPIAEGLGDNNVNWHNSYNEEPVKHEEYSSAPHLKEPTPKPHQAQQQCSIITTAEPITRVVSTRTRDDNNEPHISTEKSSNGSEKHNLLVIGQFDDLYIFCKNSDGLLIIDQHAAHERLLYEKFKKQFQEDSIPRQNLLFPETVELSLFQIQLIEKHGPEITQMGFSFAEFGGNSYVISAIPALAGHASPAELFLDILEQFGSENEHIRGGGYIDNILATMACKAAVKAGTELSKTEIDHLLNQMVKADLFSHCPHGRPVVKQFSTSEVKKWFYRT